MNVLRYRRVVDVLAWAREQPKDTVVDVCKAGSCLLHEYAKALAPESHFTMGYENYYVGAYPEEEGKPMTAYPYEGDLRMLAKRYDDQFLPAITVTYEEIVPWLSQLVEQQDGEDLPF